MLVDDAHWLDGSSADALLFAVRRLVADPIAVVLTVREGEPSLLDGADLPTLRLEGLAPERRGAPAPARRPRARPTTRRRGSTGRRAGTRSRCSSSPARSRRRSPLDVPVPVVTSVAAAYVQRAEALPAPTRDALALAAATDRGDLGLLARAGAALGVGVADLAPAEAAALVAVRDGTGRVPPSARALRDLRRRRAGAAAGDPPGARRRAARRRSRPARLAPRTRRGRARRRRRRRRSSRPADAPTSAAPTTSRRGPSSGRPCSPRATTAAGSCSTGRRTRPGSAGSATARSALLDEAAPRSPPPRSLRLELEHLRGHIALRRGPLGEARSVLLAASERAEPALAAVLLAEAVFGAFYAADAAGARACGERARALVDGRTRRPHRVLRPARGRDRERPDRRRPGRRGLDPGRARGARARRTSCATTPACSPGPRWARSGCGRPTSTRRSSSARSPRARARSAVGVAPAPARARRDRAGDHRPLGRGAGRVRRGDPPRARDRPADRPRRARSRGSRGSRPGSAARRRAASTRGEALERAPELGCRRCSRSGRSRRSASSSSGSAGRTRRSSASRSCSACSSGTASPTPTSRPRPELVELHLRLGRRERGGARSPPSSSASRPRRASRGRWRGPPAAGRCSPTTTSSRTGSRRRSPCTRRRRTCSRPRAPSSPTAPASGARAGAATRASACGARSSVFDDLGAAPWAELARDGARRHRRDGAAPRAEHARRADAAGAPGLAPARRGPDDPRGRRGALPQPEDDRVPPPQRVPQARDPLARGARAGARHARRRRRPDRFAKLSRVSWIRWESAPGPYEVVFTTREGGVSDGPFASLNLALMSGDDVELVHENRRRLCDAVGADPRRLSTNRQRHSVLVHRAEPGRYEPGDGLWTDEPGVPMLKLTADCVPIAIVRANGDRPAACALHAGWRGLSEGIVAEGVARARRRAARGLRRPRDRAVLLRGRARGLRALRRRPDARPHPRPLGGVRARTAPRGRRAGRARRPLHALQPGALLLAPPTGKAAWNAGSSRSRRLSSSATNLERIRAEVGPGVTVVAATKYVSLEDMGVLAEAGVEVVGENRAQDLRGEARALGRRVPLALHRPPPEPQGEGRERDLRALPLARLRVGGEAPRDPGAARGQPLRRGVEVGRRAGRRRRRSSSATRTSAA